MRDKNKIKITLKFNRTAVNNQQYEVMSIEHAVTVEYPNPQNIRETKTLRVGDSVPENVAVGLADTFHVVTK